MNLIWAGIICYFIGCGLLILAVDRKGYPTLYPLCFPVAYLIYNKTSMPIWLKIIFAILSTILTLGTVILACIALCFVLIMLTASELITDTLDLFDSKN